MEDGKRTRSHKDTEILYQLFDIAMTQKNTISIKEYLNKYKEEASLIIKEFLRLDSIAKNKGIAEDVYKSRETIQLLKSQLLDMERRAYYSEGKYDKMEETIDRQIEMEEKNTSGADLHLIC